MLSWYTYKLDFVMSDLRDSKGVAPDKGLDFFFLSLRFTSESMPESDLAGYSYLGGSMNEFGGGTTGY